ncbi:MAG: DUF3343 domain-containing protein [Syntrophomonadaceae bacterium]|nr:DUF3343 domain-containing protein [Syntrophomonadaceae bacterium]
MESLLSLNDYCVITFASTSQALKAEKVMKEAGAIFLTMPTPREVSASCGLALKVQPERVEEYHQLLVGRQVAIDGVFHLKKEGRKTRVELLGRGT